MPWLIKNQDTLEECLFFVHVPRCGGTSLMHHFDLQRKVTKGRSLWGKLGMAVFFSRYKTLESANFPFFTWGNAFAAFVFAPGLYLIIVGFTGLGILMVIFSVILFLMLTVIFTAPVIGRFPFVHHCYLIFVHYILCRFMESIPWCTGTNKTGYIMHLTAQKLLAYKYVTAEEMEKVCSMAIVRNPYARMVSIYSYNRFGEWETFRHFVEDWYKNVTKAYREQGEMEEWYTPCHAIPQFEYTHFEGKPLVRSIIKQEELKLLKSLKESPTAALPQDLTITNLPTIVREALVSMPHANQRKIAKKWFDYYDQRTLDLVYEMYEKDFEVFGYSPHLQQRPDLKMPHNACISESTDTLDIEIGVKLSGTETTTTTSLTQSN